MFINFNFDFNFKKTSIKSNHFKEYLNNKEKQICQLEEEQKQGEMEKVNNICEKYSKC